MRRRIEGAGLLVLGAALTYLILAQGFLQVKLLFVAPLLGSIDAWMLVFGYRQRADGMAPGWWRLGLVALSVASTAMTLHFAVA